MHPLYSYDPCNSDCCAGCSHLSGLGIVSPYLTFAVCNPPTCQFKSTSSHHAEPLQVNANYTTKSTSPPPATMSSRSNRYVSPPPSQDNLTQAYYPPLCITGLSRSRCNVFLYLLSGNDNPVQCKILARPSDRFELEASKGDDIFTTTQEGQEKV